MYSKSCLFFAMPFELAVVWAMPSQDAAFRTQPFFDCTSLFICRCFSSNTAAMAAVVRFNNHSEFYNCCSIYIKDNIQRSCEEKPQYCCGPLRITSSDMLWKPEVQHAFLKKKEKWTIKANIKVGCYSLVPVIMLSSNGLFRSPPLTSSDEPRLIPEFAFCIELDSIQSLVIARVSDALDRHQHLLWMVMGTITAILWHEWTG